MITLISLLLSAGQAPVTPDPAMAPPPSAQEAAAAPAAAPQDAMVDGLQLVCYSGADRFATGMAGQQIELDLQGAHGRVQLPHGLSGGSGKPKWVPVKDLVVGDRVISGTIAQDFMTRSALHIDRVTGMVAIGGKKPSFVGRCQTYDQVVAKRAF